MNKSIKKWMAVLGVPALLGLTAFGAMAHGFHGKSKGFLNLERIQQIVDWKLNDILETIDATETQSTHIMDLKEQLLTEIISLHTDLQDPHAVLIDQWNSETPDMALIKATIDDAAAVKKAFGKRVAEAVVELHQILTPEQRALVTTHIEEHRSRAHSFLKNK